MADSSYNYKFESKFRISKYKFYAKAIEQLIFTFVWTMLHSSNFSYSRLHLDNYDGYKYNSENRFYRT